MHNVKIGVKGTKGVPWHVILTSINNSQFPMIGVIFRSVQSRFPLRINKEAWFMYPSVHMVLKSKSQSMLRFYLT